MNLEYKDETIVSPNGIPCQVLDTESADFSQGTLGRKTAKTLVREAKGGERLETKNSKGQVETVYVAKAGDAIFVNLHNMDDQYVPGNSDGTRWKFNQVAKKGYKVVGQDQEHGGVLVQNTATAPILHEVIKDPTCIKDAWGPGQHVFLYAGATLKLNDNGHVTGIDKEAFDSTWEIVSSPRASSSKLSDNLKP